MSSSSNGASVTGGGSSKKRGGRPLKFHPAGSETVPLHFQPTTAGRSISVPSGFPMPSSIQTATLGLLEIFSGCNGEFCFDKGLNPRRVLTKPSKPAYNSGYDNEKHDYILYVNDVLGSEEGRKYVILDLLGQGTFGQVVKCQRVKTGELVAVKVIKNQPAYFNQSMMEVTVLELLNGRHDPQDRHHIVRMKDTFIFRQHLCVVVELLSLNLYELIKQNQYRGFSLQLCRVFLAQILDAMRVMKEAKIVHCDLKPENILLKSLDSPGIKVIDYGSACHEQQTLYTYIQSRFYRSPEVILGLPYSSAIDMWSLGCIAAELFLGLPIFPGASSYDQMARVVETLGVPPSHMLELGRDAGLYFDKRPATLDGRPARFTLKSRERYGLETGKQEAPSKKYFASSNLEEMVLGYAFRPKDMSPADKENELRQRRIFIDFLRGLLKLNPVERWHPQQALQHPFITGKTCIPAVPTTPTLQPTPMPTTVPVATRQRARANTLSSLSLQDVPPQIQKLATTVSRAGGQPAKPTERQPPPDTPGSDVEPPALPFEVGSVPKDSTDGKEQMMGQSKQKQQYYVDRLSTYTQQRRVSNPPTMMNSLRTGVRRSRTDSMDDFQPSTSLPNQPIWPPSTSTNTASTGDSSPRRLSGRRASDPSVQAANPPPQLQIRRKGSLGASSLSRSLTMSDPSPGGQDPMRQRQGSATLSASSQSPLMDTLEEVSEDDDVDHDDDHGMDHDADRMDID